MKLSELKNIIMECVEELDEIGPARKHRREKGYQYKDGLGDPLLNPIKDRKDWATTGRGKPNEKYARNMVKVQGTQYARKRPSGDNRYRGKFGQDDYMPRKIGSFKKLSEGTRRLDRLVNSKAHYSRSPEIRKKADKDFETAISKLRRRNKKYEEKHGQVKLANARFQRGPVKESDLGEEKKYHTEPPKTGFNRTEPMAYKKKSLSGKIMGGIRKIEKKMRVESSDDKKYPKVGIRQDLKRGQPLRITSPTGQKLKWDNKNRKWIDESGPARKHRRETGNKKQDVSGDVLGKPHHPYNREARFVPRNPTIPDGVNKSWKKRTPLTRRDGTITFDRQWVGGVGKVEGPFGSRKYRGSFKNLGKGKIK